MIEIVGSQNKIKNHAKWQNDTLIHGANDEESTFSSCTLNHLYICKSNFYGVKYDVLKKAEVVFFM